MLSSSAIAQTANGAAAQPTPMERGSGAYPAIFEERPDLPDHVVYRPADLGSLGRARLGIYVFGNGG
jgi:hypothetical protein